MYMYHSYDDVLASMYHVHPDGTNVGTGYTCIMPHIEVYTCITFAFFRACVHICIMCIKNKHQFRERGAGNEE